MDYTHMTLSERFISFWYDGNFDNALENAKKDKLVEILKSVNLNDDQIELTLKDLI